MHRLQVETEELSKDAPALSKEARNHLKVLRPKDGEAIELFDGRGRWRTYEVEMEGEGGERNVRLAPTSQTFNLRPSTFNLTLFACVTKGSRWDWTIEKATELGVSRIVPVISDRTIVRISADERAAKRARWTRIAEDAARQSDAKWIPEICEPIAFADSLARVKGTRCFVGALTNPPPQMIATALRSSPSPSTSTSDLDLSPSTSLSLYVGPEGDFTPEELAELLAIATPVSFGSTILRAETAAIYGLSVLKSHLDSLQTL